MGAIQIGSNRRVGHSWDEKGTRHGLSPGAWLEVLLFAALASVLFIASNIFSEWPALSAVPLAFLALRYGSTTAVLGCLSWILFCNLLQISLKQTPDPLAIEYLGPVLISLLCGYFSDLCRESQLANIAARQHDAQLLDEVTQSHHLLQLSHARLEQRVVGGVDTLRESLQRLHASLIASANQELPLASRGQEMLLQFDSLTWVQSASLYMVNIDDKVIPKTAAEIGEPPPLQQDGILISEAIAQRKMLAVTDVRAALEQKGPLAVAPIVDNDQRVRAIVCVHKVPFLSFNRDNLALMAVLAAHLGHMISTTERIGGSDNRQVFEHTVKRACEDATSFALPATLVQWTFKPTQVASNAAVFVRDNIRGLDHSLLETIGDSERLTLLCSLTDRSEFDAMVQRLQQMLSTRHAVELNANISDSKVHSIAPRDKPAVLLQQMNLGSHE